MTGKMLDPTPATSLVFRGPLSGPFAWVGERLLQSTTLGVRAVAGDRIEVVPSDAADPDSHSRLTGLLGDAGVLGLVGPTFSSDAERLGPELAAAGISFVVPLATKTALGEQGWAGFLRLVGTDRGRSAAVSNLLSEHGVRSTLVVADPAALGLGELVRDAMEAAGRVVHLVPIERDVPLPPQVAQTLRSATVDGVFFAGEIAEAIEVKQLLDAADQAIVMVADDGILGPEFIEEAGASLADGTLAVSPARPPLEADPQFLDAYRSAYGQDPAAFCFEAYEAGRLLAEAAKVASDRAGVLAHLRAGGADAAIEFTAQGERARAAFSVHRVHEGQWQFEGYVSANPETRQGAC